MNEVFMSCRVKICGITDVDDADLVVESGADALGVNLIPSSKRCVDLSTARAIVDRARGKVMTVAVVADPTPNVARALQQDLGVDYLQLHGNEPMSMVSALGAWAFKAVRIGDAADVQRAQEFPGELLLVDAKVDGVLGGSGVSFDWSLVTELCRSRKVVVAGGLRPDNVALAVRTLRPWCVDVASGVEDRKNPRKKNAQLMHEFLTSVRGAVKGRQ